jgi:pimeloyl-ACP methyl ester carboxylesterase
MSSLAGLRFIINTSLLKNNSKGEKLELSLSSGKTPLLLYSPIGKEKGLILSLTGFSISGYEDKRIAVVNNAFAKLGYRVITPKINTIDALLIHPSGIDEVKEIISRVTSDPLLNPNKFLPAVFAPSFTAGIAALAIAEMPAKSVSSLCLIGSFCDFETTIQFALTNEKNVDDYGMHILMKNFLKFEVGNNPRLEELVQTALEDNGLKRQVPLLPSLLAKTDLATVDLYNKLRYNTEFRSELIMRAWTKIPDFAIWKNRLDLSKHANEITCPVTIIHGKDDNVIPSSESIFLYSLLKNNNPKIHLEVSNLLDHGDMKVGFEIFSEIANLAKAFNFFMDNINSICR